MCLSFSSFSCVKSAFSFTPSCLGNAWVWLVAGNYFIKLTGTLVCCTAGSSLVEFCLDLTS